MQTDFISPNELTNCRTDLYFTWIWGISSISTNHFVYDVETEEMRWSHAVEFTYGQYATKHSGSFRLATERLMPNTPNPFSTYFTSIVLRTVSRRHASFKTCLKWLIIISDQWLISCGNSRIIRFELMAYICERTVRSSCEFVNHQMLWNLTALNDQRHDLLKFVVSIVPITVI